MEQREKISIIILIVLLMFSLVGVIVGFYSFQKERQKIFALNQQLEKLKVENDILENKLAKSDQTINRLNTELQISSSQINKLNSELKQAESEKENFSSQIEKLKSQLENQETLRSGLESEQVKAQKQIKELQSSLSDLQANKKRLEKEISDLKKQGEKEVELGKIVVGQKEEQGPAMKSTQPKGTATTTMASPSKTPSRGLSYLEGKVLVVNKGYDFAIVNLGSQNGLNVGDLLLVYQDGNYIGDLRVEKNREMMSACGFTTPDVKDKIKEGDKVIRK